MIDWALAHDRPDGDPLSQGRGRDASPRAGADRTGHGRSAPPRAATADLIACGTLLADCLAAADALGRRRARRGRDQRPLRQAAGHARRSCGRCGECPLVVTVEEGRLDGRLRQRRAGGGLPTPASTPAASAAWAFPTASSSTATAANCWPSWASTPRASRDACRQMLAAQGQAKHRVHRPGVRV